MGAGDMAFAYLENTKETAIDIKEALAQPFVLLARWIKDGNKYYYRAPIKSDGSSYAYNNATYVGLDKVSGTGGPTTAKYTDPNRNSYDSYYSSRDIPLFRLAETFLIRAEAYGRKGNFSAAVLDINKYVHVLHLKLVKLEMKCWLVCIRVVRIWLKQRENGLIL